MPSKQCIVEALSHIWQQQWLLLEQQKAGAASAENPEHLHRLRVLLRHTRALLKTFKKELSRNEVEHFSVELKWLAAATGSVRDLDVEIENLRVWSVAQGRSAEMALRPVLGRLVEERATAQRRLRRVLVGKRYQRLAGQWPDFLASLAQLVQRQGGPPARELAALKIARQSLRLVQAGLGITSSSTPLQLHSLRIRGKRLRYLLESFLPLLGRRGGRRSFLPELKALQQALGDYRDSDLAHARALALLKRAKSWPRALRWLSAWRDELVSRRLRARTAIDPAIAAFAAVCQRLPG